MSGMPAVAALRSVELMSPTATGAAATTTASATSPRPTTPAETASAACSESNARRSLASLSTEYARVIFSHVASASGSVVCRRSGWYFAASALYARRISVGFALERTPSTP